MKIFCSLAACAAVVSLSPDASAQTASASTRLQGAIVGDRSTPGVGSSTFQFASDSFNSGIVSMIASASAGGGSLSTFASAAAGLDTTPFVDDGLCRANAAMTDSFTVNLDGTVTDPVTFNFAVRASGSVAFSGGVVNFGIGGFAFSQYSIALSTSTGSAAASGRVEAGRQLVVVAPGTGFMGIGLDMQDYTLETGSGFTEFQLSLQVLPLPGGQSFNVGMNSQSAAKVNASGTMGSFMNATADFGSTLRWMGVASATLPNGSPYTGGYSISSLSGFDYSIPTPGAGLVLGLAGAMSLRRRVRPHA